MAVSDTTTASTRARPAKAGRMAFVIHSAAGLWLNLLMAVVLITGTLTVFAHEIDWLIYPETRVSAGEARVNPGALMDAVRAAHPDHGVNALRTGAYHDRIAARADVTVPGGGFASLRVDQWTGEVTGRTPFLTVGRFIDALHTTLFLPVIGRAFVNFFGILMIVSLVTGLIVYKKFWRGFFRRPRFERPARTWLGDLHRLLALWSMWFVAVIGITGAWWFYDTPLHSMAGAPPIAEEAPEAPVIDAATLDALGPAPPEALSVAEMAETVMTAFPDMRITAIIPARHAADPYTFFGDRGAVLTQNGGDRVWVNPWTGEIMGQYLVGEWSAVKRVDEAMHPLHYGTFAKGGLPDFAAKTAWFLGGAVLSFLAVSGILIHIKRLRQALAGAPPGPLRRAAWRLWLWLRPWGGPMRGFKYLNILGVVGICAGAALALSLAGDGFGDKGRTFPAQEAGPFTVSLNAVAGILEADLPPIRPGKQVELHLRLGEGEFEQLRAARASLGISAAPEDGKGTLFEGPEGFAVARIVLPDPIPANLRLRAALQDWSGEWHYVSWALM